MKIKKNQQNSGHPISLTQISFAFLFFLLSKDQAHCFSCLVDK